VNRFGKKSMWELGKRVAWRSWGEKSEDVRKTVSFLVVATQIFFGIFILILGVS